MLPQVHSSSADYAAIMIRNLRGGKLISVLNAEITRTILRTHSGFQRCGLTAYFGVTSIRTPKDGRHAGDDRFFSWCVLAQRNTAEIDTGPSSHFVAAPARWHRRRLLTIAHAAIFYAAVNSAQANNRSFGEGQ